MRIMLTGANGQVGWELSRSLMPLGEVIALDRTQCDLSKPETIPGIIQEIKPNVIVNAAAYTAVDKAEEEEGLASTINGTAVGIIAEEARKLNTFLIHFSTDYVFDGAKQEPYTEDDAPNPLNAYGRSKLAGEKAVYESGCDYLILRTTWVYAARGHNFVNTILKLVQERDELKIVADQIGAPTWARNIADATAHILRQAVEEKMSSVFKSGIVNLAASGEISWHGFAKAIVEQVKCVWPENTIAVRKLTPIPTEAYPLPAARPKNSCLATDKLRQWCGIIMPEWKNALASCIGEIALIKNINKTKG
jgi:dTDP-4-dehydrorhamnose reductase